MPNGGSDNCGTCWFNRRNNGRYTRAVPDVDAGSLPPNECLARSLPIATDPFHTYCANHPQHNADDGMVLRSLDREGSASFEIGPTVPIGPIWIVRSHGAPRVVLVDSPDNGYVREHLLAVAAEIHPHNWPGPCLEREPHRWHMVLWQLGKFREQRAVASIRVVLGVRIASRDEQLASPLVHLHARRWTDLQTTASEALQKINSHSES